MKYWEIIADNLSKAGWSWGCVSAIDSNGRTIWIADAHRSDGQRFIVRADELLPRSLNWKMPLAVILTSVSTNSHNVHLNVATVIFDAWEPFQGVFCGMMRIGPRSHRQSPGNPAKITLRTRKTEGLHSMNANLILSSICVAAVTLTACENDLSGYNG